MTTKNFNILIPLPGSFPFLRGNRTTENNWRIRQDIIVTDYPESNKKALDLLTKGVDSLGFIISNPDSVSSRNFDILLNGINPETVETEFLPIRQGERNCFSFSGLYKGKRICPRKSKGAVEADPIGRLMYNGTLCIPVEKGLDYLAETAGLTLPLHHFRVIDIKASEFRNAGAGIVTELAFAISAGTEYIARLDMRGIKPEITASKIRFSFGTGSGYFMEIAKLRAARLIWAAVMQNMLLEIQMLQEWRYIV